MSLPTSGISTRLSTALADRYRIERELGQGGMATVYLAYDLKHDRRVAIKVLKPELAAVLGADRFVVEIRTTAALQHPHILPLFDSGTVDGFLYYVMPFIDGETLRSKLDRETQLGIGEAVRIATDVADALDYAHRHGVIHRDIKPENILLHDGRPTVADFGIALAVSAAAGGRMTETGLSLGTPHYMSPEQATAEKEITARSDIYSLGAVLYEMLAGSPPHTGASAQQIIMKIVTEEAQPVTRGRKSVPPNVAAAVSKALEKLPADRFESAHAFGAALNDPGFTTARAASAVHGSSGPSRRAFAALGAVALVATALAVWGWMRPSALQDRRDTIRRQLTFNGIAGLPAISPDGRFVAYVETRCQHGQFGECRESLHLQELGGTQSTTLIPSALGLGPPRWTHDGESIVIGARLDAERLGIFEVSRLSGTARLLSPVGQYDTHPSADSIVVVNARPGGKAVARIIAIASGAGTDSIVLSGLEHGALRDVNWSPDGRHFAMLQANRVSVADRTGRTTGELTGSYRFSVRWVPGGGAVLVFRVGSVREDELVRVEVGDDGQLADVGEVILSRVPTLYEGAFDVARTTGRMVLGTGDAIADIWSFDLGARPIAGRRLTRGTTWYGEPALSNDGQSAYYLRGDALGDNLYRYDMGTNAEEALTAQSLPGGSTVRLAPDGRRLAYVHSTDSVPQVTVIEFPSRRVSGFPARVLGTWLEPLAGGRGLLGYLAGSGALAVLDSGSSEWRDIVPVDSIDAGSAAGSPDGARVAFVGTLGAGTGSLPGGATATAGTRVAGIVDLTSRGIHLLSTFPPGEPLPGISWGNADAIYLARWRSEDPMPSLWRLSEETGALQHLGDLPAPCNPMSVTVGAGGRGAVCMVEDMRGDVWVYDVAGLRR